MIKETTLDEFRTIATRRTAPLLVYFTSEDCGACRRLTPVLERVAPRLSERLEVVQIDAPTSTPLVEALHIVRLPSLVLINHGHVVASIAGYRREADLRDTLTAALTLNAGEPLPNIGTADPEPSPHEARVLRLPDEPIGQLRWIAPDQSRHEAPAAGTVQVPAGCHLQLALTTENPAALELAASLPLDGLFLTDGVDAPGLARVASLTGLSELVIDTGALDTAPLASLVNLTKLRIRCETLVPLPSLEMLALNAPATTTVDAILAAPNLQGLRLAGANLDTAQRSKLTTLPALFALMLAIPVTDNDIPWLSAMPALTTLDLPREHPITAEGLRHLRDAKPGLRLNGTWLASH